MKKTITFFKKEKTTKSPWKAKALGAALALSALFTGVDVNAQVLQLGSGTSTQSYLPLYYLYDYNYTQTIYTSAEIVANGGQAGTITKIKYKPTVAVSTAKWKDLVIYMANTTKDNFSSNTDWVPSTSLTQVFNGTLPDNLNANEWVEITLNTPFTWDSTQNLVIAVDENTPSYGNSPSWAGYTLAPSTGNKAIYKYQDTNNIDPASPPSGSRTNAVAQIRFEGGIVAPLTTPPACTTISSPANNATGVSVTPNITWVTNNAASSYLVNVGTTPGATDIVNGVEVTTSNYTIPAGTPLSYTTTYYVTILPKNAIGTATGCTETQFTTMDVPCPTVTLPANNANGQSLTPIITWDAVTGATGYTVTVGSSPGASDVVGGVDVGNATSYTFATPLANSTNYYYTINAYVGSSTSQSCVERVFTTVCTPYTIPYFEGFESGYTHNMMVGGCLVQAATTGTNPWTANNTFTDYNRTPRTGAWNAFLKYSNTRWLFIPVQLTGGTTYKFTAYARQDGAVATNSNVKVAFGDNATDAAMTNTIVAETGIISGDYQKLSGNFTPATTGTYFVGIKGFMNSSPWYISLDDISIEEAGSCVEPNSITSTGATVNSVDVSWVAPATAPGIGYDVYSSTSNTPPTATSTPTATVPNTQSTYTVTGLTENTQYFVWVRSNCSATELSAWTGPIAVYTSCGAASVPYTMDFETAVAPALPNCTSNQNVGTGNNWVVANNPGSGFTSNALKYGYNGSNPANAWFYTQGINLVGGQTYAIEFSYGNNSNTYIEKLKVAYGTTANAASMTNQIVDLPNINQNAKQTGSYNFTAPSTGVYYFGFNVYSDTNQYNLYVDDIHVVTSTMGTSELANAKEGIKIYPNPFADVLTISDVKNVKTITVADASGRLVKTINKPSNELQLGDLKTGMYLLTLEFKDGSTKTIKAMKK
ncbi:MAG: T9SS type A sorting domain-containing protein [Bacteroidetes bacterium]|nr:T9SS type A sorting domain-containing protein [Bacteroidota bacterium]